MNKISYRRSLLLGLAAVATVALAACAAKPELTRIQDPEVDFGSYKTFAFVPSQSEHPSLVERRLLAAARSQLERRGYTMDLFSPDLLVNVAAVVEDRPVVRAASGDLALRDELQIEEQRLGRLAVDLFDTRRREVVWHSAAEGRVSSAMMRDVGNAAEKAVEAVFAGFPVKPSARPAATQVPTSF